MRPAIILGEPEEYGEEEYYDELDYGEELAREYGIGDYYDELDAYGDEYGDEYYEEYYQEAPGAMHRARGVMPPLFKEVGKMEIDVDTPIDFYGEPVKAPLETVKPKWPQTGPQVVMPTKLDLKEVEEDEYGQEYDPEYDDEEDPYYEEELGEYGLEFGDEDEEDDIEEDDEDDYPGLYYTYGRRDAVKKTDLDEEDEEDEEEDEDDVEDQVEDGEEEEDEDEEEDSLVDEDEDEDEEEEEAYVYRRRGGRRDEVEKEEVEAVEKEDDEDRHQKTQHGKHSHSHGHGHHGHGHSHEDNNDKKDEKPAEKKEGDQESAGFEIRRIHPVSLIEREHERLRKEDKAKLKHANDENSEEIPQAWPFQETNELAEEEAAPVTNLGWLNLDSHTPEFYLRQLSYEVPNIDALYDKSKEMVRHGTYLEDHEQEHHLDWEPYKAHSSIFKEPLFPVDVNEVRDYWFVNSQFGENLHETDPRKADWQISSLNSQESDLNEVQEDKIRLPQGRGLVPKLPKD